jgi:hypothetical protein
MAVERLATQSEISLFAVETLAQRDKLVCCRDTTSEISLFAVETLVETLAKRDKFGGRREIGHPKRDKLVCRRDTRPAR